MQNLPKTQIYIKISQILSINFPLPSHILYDLLKHIINIGKKKHFGERNENGTFQAVLKRFQKSVCGVGHLRLQTIFSARTFSGFDVFTVTSRLISPDDLLPNKC